MSICAGLRRRSRVEEMERFEHWRALDPKKFNMSMTGWADTTEKGTAVMFSAECGACDAVDLVHERWFRGAVSEGTDRDVLLLTSIRVDGRNGSGIEPVDDSVDDS